MRTLDDIIADMVGLVREAHALGKNEGGASITRLKTKLAALLETERDPEDASPGDNGDADSASTPKGDAGAGRVRMGTVKPAIVRLINETPAGLTQDEIIEKTGFKSNSVRGTLYTIVDDGLATRISGRYFPIGPNSKGPGAGASGPSQS